MSNFARTEELFPLYVPPVYLMKSSGSHILFTVDLEDWFQVENLRQAIPFASWASRELRVEKNTHSILDILDSLQQNSEDGPARATFFVLGWIAEHLPGLVREIHSRGHEVASHGYFHRRCSDEASFGALEKDLVDSKNLLEDITGDPVHGYRSPSFSITDDLLKVIEASGYSYDSSYNSFGMNRRYGRVDLGQYAKEGISIRISSTFHEIPVSNLDVCGRILPWGGGGYFRLIPLSLFRRGVQTILKREGAYLFYIHPWELDPGQPRINAIPAFYRFRHYVNLGRTGYKVSSLFSRLMGCRFVTCRDYLGFVGGITE